MVTVSFTKNVQRHVPCLPCQVGGSTVAEVLYAVFEENEAARGYVLDDQGALRRHMVVFVNGVAVRDRTTLSDTVPPDADVFVMQALSGG